MSTSPAQTPVEAGYHWPAEWERHQATWVAWPHNRDTWPGCFEQIPPLFAQLVRTIAAFEPVNVLAGGAAVRQQAESLVGDLSNVTLLDIATNDAWCRDHGPMFLAGSGQSVTALVNWRYNAWGQKYPPFDLDDAVPRRIADQLNYRRFDAELVLEGGAIDGNGQGMVLATQSCLLNRNRNPGMARECVERLLAHYLGAQHVVWLPRGELAGDDTDGHVDQLARFVSRSTVVAAVASDKSDQNHQPLEENFHFLRTVRDQQGTPLCVVPLPLPSPKSRHGQRLPASYCNFYLANGVVVVPQFEDAADELALDVLRQLFPQRIVRGLPALELVRGLGAFHCLTQQQPEAAGGRRVIEPTAVLT